MVKAIRIVLCLLVMLVALDSISAPSVLERMKSLGRKSSKNKSNADKKGSNPKPPKSKSVKETSELDNDSSGSDVESSRPKARAVVPSPSPAAPQQAQPSTDNFNSNSYSNHFGSPDDDMFTIYNQAVWLMENPQANASDYVPTTNYPQDTYYGLDDDDHPPSDFISTLPRGDPRYENMNYNYPIQGQGIY